jgi:spore germination cell wall hydrolase CwlJ-like protein
MADRVCEATRQAALEGAGSALSILAANQSPALPDAIRDVANRVLARTAIMQTEFDRFWAVTRRRTPEMTMCRREEPARSAATFVDLAQHRARCHGGCAGR